MDLLGKKAKAELEQSQVKIRELLQVIRDQDQALYNMSQCAPNWDRIRPFLAEAMVGVDVRRQSESRRINNLILNELGKV